MFPHLAHLRHISHLFGARRRSATAAPPVSITAVVVDDSVTARVQFDGPITFGVSAGDTTFEIGGEGSEIQAQTGADEVTLTRSTGSYAVDEAWELTAQPAWLANSVTFPASGTTV